MFVFQAKTVVQQMQDERAKGKAQGGGQLRHLIPLLMKAPYHLTVKVVITHLDELRWPHDYFGPPSSSSPQSLPAAMPKNVKELHDSLGILPVASSTTALGQLQAAMATFLNTKPSFTCLAVEEQVQSAYASCAIAANVLLKEALDEYGTQRQQEEQREKAANIQFQHNDRSSDDEEEEELLRTASKPPQQEAKRSRWWPSFKGLWD